MEEFHSKGVGGYMAGSRLSLKGLEGLVYGAILVSRPAHRTTDGTERERRKTEGGVNCS